MNAKILPGKTTAFARAWQLTDGDFTSKISVRSRATGKTRAGHWIVKPASNTETAGQTTTNNSTSNKVASTSNSSASSSASSSSSATSQTSASSSSTSSQPTTLAAFVAKYGESPVAYKMDHEGMTRKAALESTPASMMSSGDIQWVSTNRTFHSKTVSPHREAIFCFQPTTHATTFALTNCLSFIDKQSAILKSSNRNEVCAYAYPDDVPVSLFNRWPGI